VIITKTSGRLAPGAVGQSGQNQSDPLHRRGPPAGPGQLPQVGPALRQPEVLRGLLRVTLRARQVRRLLRQIQDSPDAGAGVIKLRAQHFDCGCRHLIYAVTIIADLSK
jgi:hypothetical protein